MIEYKHRDFVLCDTSVLTTGVVTRLADIPQDDTDTGRDGDKLYITSQQLLWQIGQAENPNNVVRMMILRCPGNWPIAPALGDIFSNYAGGSTSPNMLLYNLDKFRAYKWKVVWTKTYFMQRITDDLNKIVHGRKKLRLNKSVQYIGGSGIATGSPMFFYIWSDSNVSPSPYCTVWSRINYNDL